MHAADTSAGADTQAALPGLPLDVLNTHILSKLSDPIDFARFRAVSASLRDAVDATGCEIKEFSIFQAAKLGHLSTLQHKLQGVPIVPRVWELALEGGHLEVLKWLRRRAWGTAGVWCVGRGNVREGGKVRALRGVEVVACERLPVGRGDVQFSGRVRALRDTKVGARERLPVE